MNITIERVEGEPSRERVMRAAALGVALMGDTCYAEWVAYVKRVHTKLLVINPNFAPRYAEKHAKELADAEKALVSV